MVMDSSFRLEVVLRAVLEEIKTQKSKPNSQIELERLKLERVKAELKLAKLRHSANNSEISLNGCVTETSIDGQIYCGDSQLPLQNTVFRPVTSRSAGGELRDNNIHCGLIRDSDLNTALNIFRELESIGVTDKNCSSQEVISLEMPVKTGAELDICFPPQANTLRRSTGDKVINPCRLELDSA
ncbi:hypothetical protein TNIN_300871 [Trichonephila inaurata madagascariensis]|uniref:Uncharacterized protein n=1 Tax=Trichonephila inaurata madagascariensis TaxID=2747483 RepID=A0A8X6YR00_9ARAC|nr:hypothetical protein TNIN_300871 [Trichonephila inaurata madagascariensis]